MKITRRLPWWIFLWAELVNFQPVWGDPPPIPRAILSVQKTPPSMPAVKEEKEDKSGMTIESKDDAKVLDLRLTTETMAVDLATVLRLAGVENPQILLARARVLEAVAERQFAAAQILPSLHLGTSYDDHNGMLQQSKGTMLQVDRNSYFVGAGGAAIAAGTVNIPGIGWNLNLSDTIYRVLMSRQFVEQQRFANRAVENQVLGRVARAYLDLLYAEGKRSLAIMNRQDAREVAKLTAAYAKAGAGRQADKQRAATLLAHREADVLTTEGEVFQASARLAELLNLDPSIRLHTGEDRVVPAGVVPEPIPLSELLAIAVLNRPELAQRQAAIRDALLALQASKALPFSPNLIIGLSYGGEGGGSNLVAEPVGESSFARGEPRFGNSAERLDFDAVAFWSLQNLGLGNWALIKGAQSRLQTANLEFLATLDQVRTEVVAAQVRTQARFAQILATEKAVQAITLGYAEDVKAIKASIGPARVAHPVELLDSLRLLAEARRAYLEALIAYNEAQLELYVALGQPPADALARPVPKEMINVK
jgi:outer membrane protein TolC